MSTMAEWIEAEKHMEQALQSLTAARDNCPDVAKAKEILELEVLLCGVASNCPNFMAAQYELESP